MIPPQPAAQVLAVPQPTEHAALGGAPTTPPIAAAAACGRTQLIAFVHWAATWVQISVGNGQSGPPFVTQGVTCVQIGAQVTWGGCVGHPGTQVAFGAQVATCVGQGATWVQAGAHVA